MSAALVLVAGCGGGADDERLDAREYRERAREICVAAQREIDRVPIAEPVLPDASEEQRRRSEALSEKREAIGRRRWDELVRLRPPAELEAARREFIRLEEENARLGREMIERIATDIARLRAEGGDPLRADPGYERLRRRAVRVGRRATAARRRLGLSAECDGLAWEARDSIT
jgi:hypothetical protein